MYGGKELATGMDGLLFTCVTGWRDNIPGQNGYDCGMYSLNILSRLNTLDGQEHLLDESSPVSFVGCMHEDRIEVLHWTADWIHLALGLSKKLHKDPKSLADRHMPDLVLTHIEQKTFSGIEQFRKVNFNLLQSTLLCPSCVKRRKTVRAGLEFEEGLILGRPKDRQGGRKDDGDKRETGDVSGGEEDSEQRDAREELLELAQRLGGKVVEGRKEGVRRSKPVQPYQFEEIRPQGVVKLFDPEFDSYRTGPTAEMVLESYIEVFAAFQASPAVARWSTVGDRFADHGYRRTAGGFHQFYLNEPLLQDQLAHLFPIPPKGVLEELKKTRNLTHVDPNDLVEGKWNQLIPEAMIKGEDMEVWTLGQMVGADAGREGTDKWMKTYITGRTDSEHLIRLDIHKSRKRVEDLQFSADIDTVIWETDNLKVVGAINLQLLPFRGDKAPIRKHNHTYVELYWPRTEMDEKKGGMSKASQGVPISNLPNTHFAHFGRAEGSAEVFVVFPRMKHKYPLRKVWETKIPYEVETFWLEKLVYPALRQLKARGIRPYTDWIFEDILYKHRGSKEKSILVAAEHLDEILATIRKILREKADDESFNRFGSLFFVLQILGIKVSSSTDDGWAGLWENLVRQHPSLAWEHMEDPENGELLVDLGVGIHPPEDAEVVGFWDVDAVRQGFDYGGYTQGTTHGVSTASAIGGIHAEMSSIRRKRTHIAYRLTYNLTYEILRGQKTRLKQGFFPVQPAYDQLPSYMDSVKGVVNAYDRNMKKSFGVRDEYRCRASSIKRLLPFLKDKVRGFELWGSWLLIL